VPFTVPGRARSYETPHDRQESKTRRELPVIGTGMLDVRRLETLLEVARTGSFAAAAKSLRHRRRMLRRIESRAKAPEAGRAMNAIKRLGGKSWD